MRSLRTTLIATLCFGIGSLAVAGSSHVRDRQTRRTIGPMAVATSIALPAAPVTLQRLLQDRLAFLAWILADDELAAGTPSTISDVPDPIGAGPEPPPSGEGDGPSEDRRSSCDEDQGKERQLGQAP